jgi:hypothetical protein
MGARDRRPPTVTATATRHNLEGWAVRFEADCWYSEYALRVMGWDEEVLGRARREQGLRCCTVRRGVRWYRGAWLDEWLTRVGEAQHAAAGAAGP